MNADRHPHDGPARADDRPVPLHAEDDDATTALLREAMAQRTAGVQPGDGLAGIRSGIAAQRRRSRWTGVAGVAAAALVATGAVVALTGTPGSETPTGQDIGVAAGPAGPTTEPPAVGGPTSASDPASAGTGDPAPASPTSGTTADTGPGTGEPAGTTVPVYWLGGGAHPQGPKLYREFLPASGATDAPTQALRLMLAGDPVDPDYTSPWRPDPQASVEVGADVITVDLSREAFANTDIGSGVAETAVQQLVHTVTAAAGTNLPVRILVDGEPGAEVWGVLAFTEPIGRAPQLDVQAPVWVTSLTDGALVEPGTLTVRGVGTAFEATLNYTLHDDGGEIVAEGYTNAGANGDFGEFSFPLDVTTGSYTLSVFAPDMSDGEGFPPLPDTKTFDVR